MRLGDRVGRSVVIAVVILALAVFGTIGAIRYQAMTGDLTSALLGRTEGARVETWNIYAGVFTEPFELCLFIFVDGTALTITTQEPDGITVPASAVIEAIERLRSVPELLAVIHNHPVPSGFSPPDLSFYADLKKAGFRGVFGIYYPATHSIRIKTDLGWGKGALK